MQWKKDVSISYKQDCCFVEEKRVAGEDKYIVQIIEKGINDDNDLIEYVKKKEKVDDLNARLRLAQFIVDYGDYLEKYTKHLLIEM